MCSEVAECGCLDHLWLPRPGDGPGPYSGRASGGGRRTVHQATGDCTRSSAERTTDPGGLRVGCTTIRRGLCELWCGRVGEPGETLAALPEQNAMQEVHGGVGVILIFATPEEARELLGLSTRQPEIVRPQTSGPCVHYDEWSEHAADTDPCTYPYGDGVCPHLDNPDVLCPVKDACYAMSEVARMRDVCEAEQDEQDADMTAREPVYETSAPEWGSRSRTTGRSTPTPCPRPASRRTRTRGAMKR